MQKPLASKEALLSTEPKLITVRELSGLLGMSKRTIWRLLSAGQVPQPVRIGRSTRWRLDEVRRWIDSGCPTANNSTNSAITNRRGV